MTLPVLEKLRLNYKVYILYKAFDKKFSLSKHLESSTKVKTTREFVS